MGLGKASHSFGLTKTPPYLISNASLGTLEEIRYRYFSFSLILVSSKPNPAFLAISKSLSAVYKAKVNRCSVSSERLTIDCSLSVPVTENSSP